MRVFEVRYIDMIADCLKNNKGFGVCLIHEGKEVGDAAKPHAVGTIASIVDWTQHDDGLLGITIQGQTRFNIESRQVMSNQLLVAQITHYPEDSIIEIPANYEPLFEKLRQVYQESGKQYVPEPYLSTDATWLSYRLAEILPLDQNRKQALLEMTDPIARLDRISDWV